MWPRIAFVILSRALVPYWKTNNRNFISFIKTDHKCGGVSCLHTKTLERTLNSFLNFLTLFSKLYLLRSRDSVALRSPCVKAPCEMHKHHHCIWSRKKLAPQLLAEWISNYDLCPPGLGCTATLAVNIMRQTRVEASETHTQTHTEIPQICKSTVCPPPKKNNKWHHCWSALWGDTGQSKVEWGLGGLMSCDLFWRRIYRTRLASTERTSRNGPAATSSLSFSYKSRGCCVTVHTWNAMECRPFSYKSPTFGPFWFL